MKIINEYPPNIEKIKERFDVPDNAIFTYGDALYNPNGVLIGESLMKHEEKHAKQQGDNPEEWWNKYFQDKEFRLSQEVEAYKVQYKSAKSIMKDREELNRYLHSMACDLSSAIYGNICDYHQAINLIKFN